MPRLIEDAVKYHCRKGMREWCDCSYCNTKRNGTYKIMNAGGTTLYLTNQDWWTHSTLIDCHRHYLRKELRNKLKQQMEL